MIDSVKIGAMTYRVVEKPGDDMAASNSEGKAVQLNGRITYHDLLIQVNQGCAPDMRRAVVVHEAVHGILENAGQSVPEAIVEALGYGIVALIRDNPALVEWLQIDHSAIQRFAVEVARGNGDLK